MTKGTNRKMERWPCGKPEIRGAFRGSDWGDSSYSSEAVMRLDYQLLLKLPPLKFLAGSAPAWSAFSHSSTGLGMFWQSSGAGLDKRRQKFSFHKKGILHKRKKYMVMKANLIALQHEQKSIGK